MRAGLPLLLLVAGCGDQESAIPDGMWAATAIDGEPVPPDQFLIRVRAGRVTGGRDGCNSWAFDATQPPMPNGTRMIVSDLQECRETPARSAYWRALGNGNAVPRTNEAGALQLRAGGAQIIARPVSDRWLRREKRDRS